MSTKRNLVAIAVFAAMSLSDAQCPFKSLWGGSAESVIPTFPAGIEETYVAEYKAALASLDWDAVKADIVYMLTDSKDFWPADFGNYGGLMIRNAWHCAGSYRTYDGIGGCDGARIRFDPERSWDDNTNLDKARKLLYPIKEKYGLGLSWGDLIILAGTAAIESMGGPVLGFCGGRLDDPDGSWSELLGPTAEQEAMFHCEVQGDCKAPLGATTVGLIYVNPEGPQANHEPISAAAQIREVFGRMSMNDTETVSLIGGGHAFGKAHGACPAGAGPSPKDDPLNPWPGMCGTGKGADAATSGLEGAWTSLPTQWTNMYFTNLLDFEWVLTTGSGGKGQWKTADGPEDIMMLTTDIALLHDEKGEYQKIVDLYAKDQAALDNDFAHSWYKLVTRDMGPVSRCAGPWVAPAQKFQNPLPAPPINAADFNAVKESIKTEMVADHSAILKPDLKADGTPYYGAQFIYLAYQCASTFRVTDYQGGCNGARIRFAPELNWTANKGMDGALQILNKVKDFYGEALTWADLIVLAGNVAIEEATGKPVKFCGGRSDAIDGSGSESLQPNGNKDVSVAQFRLNQKMLGLSNREMVALAAMPRSVQQMERIGYIGSWNEAQPEMLSNTYFKTLLNEKWEPFNVAEIERDVPAFLSQQYKAAGKELYMLPSDLTILLETDYLDIAMQYAASNDLFLSEFASAWVKLMNNDRFDGPTGNVCNAEPAAQIIYSPVAPARAHAAALRVPKNRN